MLEYACGLVFTSLTPILKINIMKSKQVQQILFINFRTISLKFHNYFKMSISRINEVLLYQYSILSIQKFKVIIKQQCMQFHIIICMHNFLT